MNDLSLNRIDIWSRGLGDGEGGEDKMATAGAYGEGQKAFYQRKDINDNPYPFLDADYDEWESGYLDADTYESGKY